MQRYSDTGATAKILCNDCKKAHLITILTCAECKALLTACKCYLDPAIGHVFVKTKILNSFALQNAVDGIRQGTINRQEASTSKHQNQDNKEPSETTSTTPTDTNHQPKEISTTTPEEPDDGPKKHRTMDKTNNPTQPAQRLTIRKGDTVIIANLVNNTAINGLICRVNKWVPEKERWEIHNLQNDEYYNVKEVNITHHHKKNTTPNQQGTNRKMRMKQHP